MRTPAFSVISSALVLALVACRPAAAPEADQSPVSAPALAEADSKLLEPLVVSTNEPFWQLQIQGQSVDYSGLDVEPQRKLQVAEDEISPGQRRLLAVDAQGRVEIHVLDQACSDSMSGGQYPYSAQVQVDGQTPVHGCARPASMPPPGEPGE